MSAPETKPDTPLDILFIGSSYFASNDLPSMVGDLIAASGKDINISTEIVPGRYLDYHAKSSATALRINEKEWDYIFLQGGCTTIAYPEPDNPFSSTTLLHPLLPSLVTLEAKIHGNCERTKMVYFMPWAYEDGMTFMKEFPWIFETYDVMQQRIIDNTLLFAGQVDFVIAPVGSAFRAIITELHNPLHYLHQDDWNHPSLFGSYLAACVIYSTLYLETAEGIEYYAGISEATALHFQEVGSTTVLAKRQLWKLAD
ncbi:MAG: hypothetical protein JW814_11985 [Candidatus Krumholzibacteriota bacterium]|nr:hypothetical protein [Candidatus Krumholzibacteriota bacterium]